MSSDRQRSQSLEANGAISQQEREAAELTEIARTRDLEAARREVDAAVAEATAAREALTILSAEQHDLDYLLRVYDAQIVSIAAELANRVDEAARTEVAAPCDLGKSGCVIGACECFYTTNIGCNIQELAFKLNT